MATTFTNQSLTIEIDKQQLADVNFMLSTVKNGARDAIRRAANRTATTARSRVVKKIAETMTLTQKRIRQDTKILRANFSNLTAKVSVSGKPIPLINFKHGSQLKTGINVEVRRGQKVKYKHRFIAQMPTGYTGIFERALLASGKPVGRLPIEEIYGPSTAMVFHFNGEKIVFDDAMLIFQKNLDAEINFILTKAT